MKTVALLSRGLVALFLLGSISSSSVSADATSDSKQAVKWDLAVEQARQKRAEATRERAARDAILEKKLEKGVLVHFDRKPLHEVIAELGKLADVKIVLDRKGLASEGVSGNVPISLDCSAEIWLRTCLNLLLEPYHLAYCLDGDTVRITSDALAHSHTIDVSNCSETMIKLLLGVLRKPGDSPNRFRVCRESGKVTLIVRKDDEDREVIEDSVVWLIEMQQKYGLF